MTPLLNQRRDGLDRFRDGIAQRDPLDVQLHLAARHARDVEQIVDEPRQVDELPLDDLLLARELRAAAHLDEVQRSDDRRQRIAQLVAEHREKLVLGARRPLAFQDEPRRVQRARHETDGRAQHDALAS